MTRKSKTIPNTGRTILLVDDNPEYLEATRLLLEHEGHQVLCASNGTEALELLHERQIDLMLLDYYMPGMTGEEVVVQLRQFNPFVQVILQTGYASEQPPRELLRRLDIQGYYDKTEGPEKLLLWTDVGLKIAYTVQMLNKSRQGLSYILNVTPDLHKIQPLEDLLNGILHQVAGLIGAVNSFLAVLPESALRGQPVETNSFLAIMEDDMELVVRAGTGQFEGQTQVAQCLPPPSIRLIRDALQQSEIQIVDSKTIVPLRVGQLSAGVIYLDRPAVLKQDLELLHIFANQAAVAIQNAQLYEIATLDLLTKTYVRGFFDKWLLRELRVAFRSRQFISLLMLDLDGMKQINDTAGHLVGDQALAALGQVLHKAMRAGDIVGRYGGDEFAIILPRANAEDAARVGQRILALLSSQDVPGLGPDLRLRSSVGVGTLGIHTFSAADIPRPIPTSYFQAAYESLIKAADQALYQAKNDRGNQVRLGDLIAWPTPKR